MSCCNQFQLAGLLLAGAGWPILAKDDFELDFPDFSDVTNSGLDFDIAVHTIPMQVRLKADTTKNKKDSLTSSAPADWAGSGT